MTSKATLRWFAERLSRHAGADTRTEELRSHLADLAESGQNVSIADVGSVAFLVLRTMGLRVARDLPWWLAGLPIAFLLVIPHAFAYETHFFAWDMIEREPATQWARSWKTVVNGLAISTAVLGLIAGRRAVEHLRQGRILLPGFLLLALVAAATQADLFVERTPWMRDGGLQEAHIEEVPLYSVGLVAAFTFIPIAYLAIDFVVTRAGRPRPRAGAWRVDPGPVDPLALATVAIPLLLFVVGVLWVLPFVVLVWLTPSFSRRLKVTASGAAAGPLAVLVAWSLVVGDIDDGLGFLVPAFLIQLIVWARLAFVALRPLRDVDMAVVADNSV